MRQRLVILDGSSLLYRAFYALPPLNDSHGQPVNAIVGFSNMLTKLLTELEPTHLIIAFDKGRKTFRTEKYEQYKGTRDKTPEELLAQIPLLHEFAAAFGIFFIEKDNYEADDLIGTLATQAAALNHDVMVVTGDRDALQLIRPNLRVLLTKKGLSEIKDYDEAAFKEEYGLEPIRLIDLKGLMGDSSDNIPGVPGVGPKTASKLLQEYGSLEAVLANIDKVSGKKLQERLRDNTNQAILSKELATIELQVPDVKLTMTDYEIKPQSQAMEAFCKSHEMQSVWRNFTKLYGNKTEELTLDFTGGDGSDKVTPDYSYTELTPESAKKLWAESKSIAIAGLFSGKAPFAKLNELVVYSVELAKLWSVKADSALFFELVDKIATTDIAVSLCNLKRYYQAGFSPRDNFFDIELAEYLLAPEQAKYELSMLAGKYFPDENVPSDFVDEISEKAWEAQLIGRLQKPLTVALADKQLTKLYQDMELPLVEVLAAMEQNGIYVNKQQLTIQADEVAKKVAALEQEIYALAGTEFNIKSPKQLAQVLFERLNLPVIKKTKTGYSTNADVLDKLRFAHPVVEKILAYRSWIKLKSTYLDSIGHLINPETGRVHTSFNQTVTATGRLSSSEPNLQNIPVRTEEGRTIRTLFEPGTGFDLLLSADYSQIELRLLAHLSGDEGFIEAFCQNQDIHARTAAKVFNVPLDEVTSELRRKAKAVNFGIVYGISDFGLAKDLHISKGEAKEYIESYFERYPGVKKYLDTTVEQAHKTGGVTTMFGRHRQLVDINSRNFTMRSFAERMAMNTPIQGSAADVIKLAMIAAYKKIKEAKLTSRILLQVHDELVLEVKAEELTQVTAILRETMEQVVKLAVPLVIDVNSGKNWAEAK